LSVEYSVADPDLGSGAFLSPGSGLEKNSGSEDPRSYLLKLRNSSGLKILKLFHADPDPGFGMEKFGSRIGDKHPGSAALIEHAILSFVNITIKVKLF